MKSSFAVMPFMKNIRTCTFLLVSLASSAAWAQTQPDTPPQTPPPAPTQVSAPVQTSSQAKDETLTKMRVGMKIQPSLAWISTDSKDYESNGSEFRFAWGGVAEFRFGERYYFSTGIDVSNRGGAVRMTQTFTDSTVIID